MRIKVTYFDQNESFGRAMPQSGLAGTIVCDIAANDACRDWSVSNSINRSSVRTGSGLAASRRC